MADAPEVVLEWEVRAWESQPSKRIVCGLAALAAALAGLFLFRSPILALLGGGIIVASTVEMFFPIRNVLTRKSARSRVGLATSEIEWADVKRVIRLDGAFRLSPLEKPSRLDAFRGVLLRCSGNEGAVWDTICALQQTDERCLAGPTIEGGGDGVHRGTGAPDREEEA